MAANSPCSSLTAVTYSVTYSQTTHDAFEVVSEIPSSELEISSRASLIFFSSSSRKALNISSHSKSAHHDLPLASTVFFSFSAARRFSASSFQRLLSWQSCVYSWLGRESIRMSTSWQVLVINVEKSIELSAVEQCILWEVCIPWESGALK